jgi:hypothetical protein
MQGHCKYFLLNEWPSHRYIPWNEIDCCSADQCWFPNTEPSNAVFRSRKPEINGRGNSSRCPRNTLLPQRLALTSPTSSGRSVGIVRLRITPTEFNFLVMLYFWAHFKGPYFWSWMFRFTGHIPTMNILVSTEYEYNSYNFSNASWRTSI